MIIYGGVNTLGEYKNDFWELNLKTNLWQNLDI